MPLADVARQLKSQGILVCNKAQLVRWSSVGTAPIVDGRSQGRRIKLTTRYVSGMRYSSIKLVLKWIDDVDKAQRAAEAAHSKRTAKSTRRRR